MKRHHRVAIHLLRGRTLDWSREQRISTSAAEDWEARPTYPPRENWSWELRNCPWKRLPVDLAAMGRTPLIDDDVAAGRLAIAVDRPVPVTSGYWWVKPPGIETRCEIVAFRNWLLKEMSQLNWNRYSDPAAKVASLRHRGVRQAVFQTMPVWSLPRSAVAPPLKPHKLAARS